MKKFEIKLLFADVLLGVIIIGVVLYGKIVESGQLQPQKRNLTEEVIYLQKSEKTGESGMQGEVTGDTGTKQDEETFGAENTQDEPAETESKTVALTFDDGPDPEYTPLLLEGLRERGVQATFFLLGQQMEQYPGIVEEIYEDGHTIGIHSYEHVNLNLLPESEACKQIQSAGDLIFELTGTWPAYVRPPYGNWPEVLDRDFCLVTVFWDVDPLDWATEDVSLIVQRILENVEEYDIILLHDASDSSVQAALQVIDILTEEGYRFVTVEDLIFP